MIDHCGQTATVFPLRKPLGSHNVCDEYYAESIARRFGGKVRRGDPATCWPWQASTTGSRLRYGQFKLPRINGRQPHAYAHRMAWMLTHGPIPDGLSVCHRCDNPVCCNPTHLFLGTQTDNMQDASANGRLHVARRGVKLSLGERAVIYARLAQRRRGDMARIADEYGVSKALISRMARQCDFQAVTPLPKQPNRYPHVAHQAAQVLSHTAEATPQTGALSSPFAGEIR